MSLNKIGERIRSYRTAAGMTLQDVADIAEISKGYLWQLEEGVNQNPSIDVLAKIAKALDKTIAELTHGGPLLKPAIGERIDIPDSLKELVRKQKEFGIKITDDDVAVLAGIRYRGKRPTTLEDWLTLFTVIKSVSKTKK